MEEIQEQSISNANQFDDDGIDMGPMIEEYLEDDFFYEEEDDFFYEEDDDPLNSGAKDSKKCNLCQAEIAWNQLQQHMEDRHAKHECSKCKKKYFSASMLRRHLRSAHLEGMRLQCPFCPLILKTKYNLQQHLYTHSTTALFKCSYKNCPKSFKHVNTLKQHEKIHDNRNRRECHICHEMVTRLQTHILTHSNERPYKCDMCDRAYTSKQHLKVHHQTSHTTRQDIVTCDICESQFKNATSLYKHQKSVHSNDEFACPECDRVYKRRDNMISHAKKAHSGSAFVENLLRKKS